MSGRTIQDVDVEIINPDNDCVGHMVSSFYGFNKIEGVVYRSFKMLFDSRTLSDFSHVPQQGSRIWAHYSKGKKKNSFHFHSFNYRTKVFY